MPLFNGKDIEGWTAWTVSGWRAWAGGRQLTAAETAGIWRAEGGVLHGIDGPSYLVHPHANYRNFRLRAEAKINDGGNSGIFFRLADASRLTGYEAQINSTHQDPNKTGSLYRVSTDLPPISVNLSPVPPDTWFTLGIEVIRVPHPHLGQRHAVHRLDRPAEDRHPRPHRHPAHHPGSHVQIRKLEDHGVG